MTVKDLKNLFANFQDDWYINFALADLEKAKMDIANCDKYNYTYATCKIKEFVIKEFETSDPEVVIRICTDE